jgi:hypothetical protein
MTIRYSLGEASAPHGDPLVVIWDNEKESPICPRQAHRHGDLARTREEQTSWTTPPIVEAGGRAQITAGHRPGAQL